MGQRYIDNYYSHLKQPLAAGAAGAAAPAAVTASSNKTQRESRKKVRNSSGRGKNFECERVQQASSLVITILQDFSPKPPPLSRPPVLDSPTFIANTLTTN